MLYELIKFIKLSRALCKRFGNWGECYEQRGVLWLKMRFERISCIAQPQNLLLCNRYYGKAEWIDTKTYGNFNILSLRYSYRFSRWHATMGIARNYPYPILGWLNNSDKLKDKCWSMTMIMVRQCYARSALIGDARIYQKQQELHNIACPPETHLKIKSHELSFAHNIRLSRSVILKFCTEHGGISVEKFTTNGQLWNMLWANEISRDLSLRCVSDGYPTLHKTPEQLIEMSM